MTMSADQLAESKNAWFTDVLKQISTFAKDDPDTLRLRIEAEKVSILYEIAMQLVLSNRRDVGNVRR